jgi:hypothetical protein
VCDWRHAGFLELLGQGHEVVERLGLGPAHLVEQGLVHPDPVGRVHVEGRCHVVTIVLDDVLQRRRDHLVPAVLVRELAEIAQRPLLGPVLHDQPQHLHRGGRVAGGHARLQHGAGLVAAAPGDRGVLPGHALLLQVLPEHLERRRLAARGPPVDDLDLLGRPRGLGRAQREAGHGRARQQDPSRRRQHPRFPCSSRGSLHLPAPRPQAHALAPQLFRARPAVG